MLLYLVLFLLHFKPSTILDVITIFAGIPALGSLTGNAAGMANAGIQI